MQKLITAALLLACAPAYAQVFQCMNASGQKIFSDRPCGAVGGQGTQIQRARSAEAIAEERYQAAEATHAKNQRRLREEQAQLAEDMQARANAVHSAPAGGGYAQRLAERNAGVKSNLTGGGNDRGMTRGQRELALSQANSPEARKEALREATTVLPGAHGLTASQMDAAQRLVNTPAGQPIPRSTLPPPPPPVQHRQPAPSVITHCSGGICHDDLGGTYVGGGSVKTGPNGSTCVKTGSMVECH